MSKGRNNTSMYTDVFHFVSHAGLAVFMESTAKGEPELGEEQSERERERRRPSLRPRRKDNAKTPRHRGSLEDASLSAAAGREMGRVNIPVFLEYWRRS